MTDLPMDHSIDVHITNGASGIGISEDSAAETWNMSGIATQTDTAGYHNDCAVQTEYDNERYVITNHVSHEYYYCQFCGFHTDTMAVCSVV